MVYNVYLGTVGMGPQLCRIAKLILAGQLRLCWYKIAMSQYLGIRMYPNKFLHVSISYGVIGSYICYASCCIMSPY